MRMVEFEVKDRALHIKLLPEAREDVEALRGQNAFGEVIEHQLGNGWQWVQPEDIGALTSAPILSDEVEYDDGGEITKVGRVFYFADYALRDEIEDLLARGEVVFRQCD